MKDHTKNGMTVSSLLVGLCLVFGFTHFPVLAQAQDDLRERVEQMEQQLEQMKRELDEAKAKAESAEKKAKEEEEALVKWHLAGYAHADFMTTDADGEEDSFSGASFSPVFHFQYDDLLLFEAEPEISVNDEGETDIELEYAQLNLLLHDSVTLAAGQILSPVGQFQERLHPAWINKSPDAPAGFGHGGIQPLSDVGVQVRGGIPVSDMTVTYAVGVGNGPRIGHHGLELEAFGDDDNSNKAVAGRIGFLPFPYFEVGGSFMTAEATGEPGTSGDPGTDADFTLWGVDAAYTRGPWDIRGEYLHAELDSFFGRVGHNDANTTLIPATDWEAWYVQVAYQLSGLTDTPIVRNFEPVIRYGQFTGDGHDRFTEEGEDRFNIGLNYLFAPSIIAKGSVEWRDFEADDAEDETRFLFQLAYGF